MVAILNKDHQTWVLDVYYLTLNKVTEFKCKGLFAARLSDKYINARAFIQNVIIGSTNEKAALRCT